ncbi:MAG: hypothetical protein ACYSR0_11585 [Planctomycetota bacterium]
MIVKSVLWSKIVSSTLGGCILIAIFELAEDKIKTHRFIRTLVLLISIKAVIYMVLSFMDFLGILTLGGQELVYNYEQAYESLTVIFIILFHGKYSDKLPYKHLYLCLNALPMFFFDCRGALVSFLFLWGMYVIKVGFQKRFIYQKLTLIVISCIFLLGISQLLGSNILQVRFLASVVQEKRFLPTLSKMWSFGEKKEQVNFVWNQLGKLGNDFEQNDLLIDSPAITSKTLSAYSRIASIILALDYFIRHPVIGIGSHKAYSLRVKKLFGIHSYIPLLLASYGLFGFLPFLIFCALFTYKQIKCGINYLDIFVLYGYIMLIMAIGNQFIWWYSLLVVLACDSKSPYLTTKALRIDQRSLLAANHWGDYASTDSRR